MSNGNQNAENISKFDKFFGITERGSTVKTEIAAGVTTFMTMCYILMVNAGMFSFLGLSYGGMYIATAISAIIGTVLVGLLARLPLAQAAGMGLNAFFVYTVCAGLGLTYENALVLVLIDGVVFVILTVTGLRKAIFNAIPAAVRKAIPAGIGLFIAFIGLQDAKLIVDNGATLVGFASFNLLGSASWSSVMPLLVTFFAFIVMAILSKKNVKGAILWGMLVATALYYLLGLSIPGFYDGFGFTFHIGQDFIDFGTQNFFKVFTKGFDFSAYAAAHGGANLALIIITTALAFCLVDMFDTLGTLYGACSRGGMLDKNGDVPNMNKAMLADAIATCCGSVCGTSTVTTYVESAAGIAEGGRTGFAAMITAFLFLVAMFFSPLAALIPTYATAAALIYVGVLMMGCVKELDWNDASFAVPSFLTIIMMPLTYNISYGIGLGIISFVLIHFVLVVIKLFQGKAKEINWKEELNPVTIVIAALFGCMFFLTH